MIAPCARDIDFHAAMHRREETFMTTCRFPGIRSEGSGGCQPLTGKATSRLRKKAWLRMKLFPRMKLSTDGGSGQCGLAAPAVQFCSKIHRAHHVAAMVLCGCGQQVAHSHQV